MEQVMPSAVGALVILGANTRAADIARTVGCPLIFVQGPGDALLEPTDTWYSVDYASPEFLDFVGDILAGLKPRAVVSLTEAGLWPAALANEMLGLPGTGPKTVALLRDKVMMRTHLAANGAFDLSVRHGEPRDGPHAAEIMSSWPAGSRAILKPRAGTASTDIELIEDPWRLGSRGDLRSMILEEYLPGQEYSVETFSVDGRHELVAVAEKQVDPGSFVETGHVVPAPSLSEADIAAVAVAVSRFLDVVGLRNGPGHTEFKIQDGAVRIIESHNRFGGGEISRLTQLVTGVDMVRASLGWPVGHGLPGDRSPSAASAAAVAFATAPPGIVRSTALPTSEPPDIGVESVACYVKAGDLVQRLSSSKDRIGHVIVTAPTAVTAMDAARKLIGEMDVRIVSVGFGTNDGW